MKIPFNKIFFGKEEIQAIKKVCEQSHIGNYGPCSKKAEIEINNIFKTNSILTHSCTAALEMAAILLDIKKGDEVIIPSFTFVTSANAFALRGAKIIFADINKDNLNIDINKIKKLITRKTKAIIAVHYAGVACDLDELKKISNKNKIYLIEDAAQAFMSRYNGKFLGTFGDLSTFSFHETKNLISGQGGALLINNKKFLRRAKYLRDKGTNRSDFTNYLKKKYTWVDLGSSYTMGELSASLLLTQLKKKKIILKKKRKIWNSYFNKLKKYDGSLFKLPQKIKDDSNGHIFYIILNSNKIRTNLIQKTRKYFELVTHYEPLHRSKAGKIFGKTKYKLQVTDDVCNKLVRVPAYVDLSEKQIKFICDKILRILKN